VLTIRRLSSGSTPAPVPRRLKPPLLRVGGFIVGSDASFLKRSGASALPPRGPLARCKSVYLCAFFVATQRFRGLWSFWIPGSKGLFDAVLAVIEVLYAATLAPRSPILPGSAGEPPITTGIFGKVYLSYSTGKSGMADTTVTTNPRTLRSGETYENFSVRRGDANHVDQPHQVMACRVCCIAWRRLDGLRATPVRGARAPLRCA